MPTCSIPSFTNWAKSPVFLAGNMEPVPKSAWLLRKSSWKKRRFLGWVGSWKGVEPLILAPLAGGEMYR